MISLIGLGWLRVTNTLQARLTNDLYEYVKDKNEVFRYDNFAKHPGIRPPFHHKHISKRRAIQMKEAPKLIDIIEEALRYMF